MGIKLHSGGFLFWIMLAALPASCAEVSEPGLLLQNLDGTPRNLGSLQAKIVLLNFWATWCGPCAGEMPMLVEVQKRYASRGVIVIGASLDDASTRSKIPPFIRRKKINFPIWVGASPEDLARFGLGEALPSTVFFDAEGRIVGRVVGKLRKRDLKPRLEWMLGSRKGPPPPPLVDNLNSD